MMIIPTGVKVHLAMLIDGLDWRRPERFGSLPQRDKRA